MQRFFITWSEGKVDEKTKPGFEISKDEMGGKGANLALMCLRGYPVPPGFTITTAVCRAYQKNPKAVMAAIAQDLPQYLEWMKKQFGYMPLLSVRSGAPISMPGMMDTILNVGMNSAVLKKWRERIGDAAALDSWRRLYEMYGQTVLGLDKTMFELHTRQVCKFAGVERVQDLTNKQLFSLIARFDKVFAAFEQVMPDDLEGQVLGAIEAVFKSWNGERACVYRKLHHIADDMGTAVNVQAMVFGNMGETSGTGVLFTRNPSTGAPGIHGEFLVNAQGEDVVAGGAAQPMAFRGEIHHGKAQLLDNAKTPQGMVAAMLELIERAHKLEIEQRDMQDIEFTIQDGKLWLLQTRSGKRSATAAFRIAKDMMAEGLLDLSDAARRVTATQFAVAQRPTLDREATVKKLGEPVAKGLVGSTGVAIGAACFSQEHVQKTPGPKILIRHETTPDDIALMDKSVGILTATGGFTSHAAVVARGMDKPCITACEGLHVGSVGANIDGKSIEGVMLTLNADTGEVWVGEGVLANSGADEAEAFILSVMDEQGLKPRTTRPMSDAHLVAAPALIEGKALEWVHSLIDAKVSDALLDFRLPHDWLRADDRAFIDLIGADNSRAMADLNGALLALVDPNGVPYLLNSQVLLPEVASKSITRRLSAAGYVIVARVNTLEEALAANGPVILSPKVQEMAGGEKSFKMLQHLILQNGGEVAGAFSMSLGEAAGALLG